MKPEAREVFYKWYGTQREKQVVFNMEEELLKYCRSDVDILRRCCLNFAKTVKGVCKIDPFEHCIIINLIFRIVFLKKETIAIIRTWGTGRKSNSLPWPIVGCRMWHTNKVLTFNMVAMPETDAKDRIFGCVLRGHTHRL